MHDVTSLDCSRIAQDLQIRKVQVESVVQLLDEGNTVPFITRYRKERTSGLNEEVIRQIQARVGLLRQLADRKQTILKSIEGQGKLTAELRAAILAAETTKRLEDLYLPYKPKKKTLATTARERGLEPLALAIWYRDAAVAGLEEALPAFVNPEKGLTTADEVRAGIQHILAELIAETADVRAAVRSILWETGKICAAKNDKLAEGQGLEFKDYFQFNESLRQIPPHRILALNRGEKEGALKIRIEWVADAVNHAVLKAAAEFALKSQAEPRRQAASGKPEEKAKEPASPAETEACIQINQPSEAPGTVPPLETAALAGQVLETPPLPLTAEDAAVVQTPPAAATTALLPEPCPLPADQGDPLCPASAFRTPHAAFLKTVVDDALHRLLLPSLEREIRNELTDEAEGHAVAVFARNLRSLLLQPPLRNRRLLAIDPGFRTGCKVAVLDEIGNLLDEAVIYPHSRKGPRERGPKEPPPSGDASVSAGSSVSESEPTTTTAEVAPSSTNVAETPTVSAALEASPPSEFPAPITLMAAVSGAGSTTPAPLPEGQSPAETPLVSLPEGVSQTAAQTPAAETQAIPAASEPAKIETPLPPNKRDEASAKLEELIVKHGVQVIAIGNGTGCRDTEEFVSELIASRLPDLAYVIVNEAGASVYSVSQVGREEFPTFDSTLRGTISIGRRLQDPLSELVKVDPQSIGVGLYQHDVKRKDLKESLEGVVESCVNQVGVDLNTASVPLLRHVSGLNQMVARELVEYRKQHGAFRNREQLMQIPGVGPARYVQAAGFLKIHSGDNVLDTTWIHPESYNLAHQILAELGYGPEVIGDQSRAEEFQAKLKALVPLDLANRLAAGLPTVSDILQALARPGRDPREDLPPPIFKKGILKLEDLQPGMELKGTVLNVVDFGAFVDIGLKDSGLVHISQMANRYIKSPYDVAAVNDVVTVWVLSVDQERHRVSLTMIKPGTERKPGEKKPGPPRQAQGGRPPRGRRPDQAVSGQGGPPEQGSGPPPRRGRGPRRGHAPARPQGAPQTAASADSAPPPAKAAPPPRPAHPPRKPRREAPRPKLSQDALEGKVPLRTFGELSALFAAKEREPQPSPQPVVAASETAVSTQEPGPEAASSGEAPA